MIISVDAFAWKGVLLRTSGGKVKGLRTKQLRVLGYSVETKNIPSADNVSDIVTHPVGESEVNEGLRRVEHHFAESAGVFGKSATTVLGNPCGNGSMRSRGVA